jgi:hypothetical protein
MTIANMAENGNKCSTLDRYCKSVTLGCAIPLSIGTLAIVVSVCKSSFSLEVWGTAAEFVAIALIPGAAAGGVGGAVKSSGRASAYGIAIFLCAAGEYLWWSHWTTWPIAVNLLVFASTVGALAGGTGAAIARVVPVDTAEAGRPRMSLSESVIGVILAAILLIYIVWIV